MLYQKCRLEINIPDVDGKIKTTLQIFTISLSVNMGTLSCVLKSQRTQVDIY